jgi:Arc/MetJ-type ribon-helix-helix transcriptional regulator
VHGRGLPVNTQRLDITLPIDLTLAVKAEIVAGEYATDSAVICAGLHLLLHGDHAKENWLRTEVTTAYDGLKTDPTRPVSVGQVRARLAALSGKPAERAWMSLGSLYNALYRTPCARAGVAGVVATGAPSPHFREWVDATNLLTAIECKEPPDPGRIRSCSPHSLARGN